MKPFMRQRCSIISPAVNTDGTIKYDRFGKPITKKVDSVCRVRRKSNFVRTRQGTEIDTNIEIDIPPKVFVNAGDTINFIDMDNISDSGVVVDYEEATNVSGSRVLFRTVFVDGR